MTLTVVVSTFKPNVVNDSFCRQNKGGAMRLASILAGVQPILAARAADGEYVNLSAIDPTLGTEVGTLLASGPEWRAKAEAAASRAPPVEATGYRPLIVRPTKLLCLGLNDRDHAAEGNFPVPDYPAVFGRFASSLIGHRQPMLRPPESEQLDYEVELAVIIGKSGRRIKADAALDHVAGYSVFNDGTIRNYSAELPSGHWQKLARNGRLGPELVTTEELPAGADGLELTTHVGEQQLQDGNTSRMVFSVAETIAILSEFMVLEPSDVDRHGHCARRRPCAQTATLAAAGRDGSRVHRANWRDQQSHHRGSCELRGG